MDSEEFPHQVLIERKDVPRLLVALNDPAEEVRALAARALGGTTAKDAPVLAALAAAAADPSPKVREEAAQSLCLLGSDSSCISALSAALGDSCDAVRFWALRALMASNCDLHPMMSTLAEMFADRDSLVADGAARALNGLGAEGIAELVAKLKNDPRPFVRARAATALGELAKSIPLVQEALQTAFQSDSNPKVKIASASSLVGLEENGILLSGLLVLVRHDDPSVREGAAFCLGKIDTADAGRTLLLESLCSDANPNVRARAAESLRHLRAGDDRIHPQDLPNAR